MLRGFMREDGTRMRAVALGDTADMAVSAADVGVAERQVPSASHCCTETGMRPNLGRAACGFRC